MKPAGGENRDVEDGEDGEGRRRGGMGVPVATGFVQFPSDPRYPEYLCGLFSGRGANGDVEDDEDGEGKGRRGAGVRAATLSAQVSLRSSIS